MRRLSCRGSLYVVALCLVTLFVQLLNCNFAVEASEIETRASEVQAPVPTGVEVQAPKHVYRQFSTRDKFGRSITFYLSEGIASSQPVPLVVAIQGSGGDSLFLKSSPGQAIEASSAARLLDLLGSRGRLLLVEKPGVQLFDEAKIPGVAEGCREEFLSDYTADRWTEAINAAIESARLLPGIDSTKLLVIGHSEGGQVAPHVAAFNSHVTHVVNMAGGGPTQLFDMMVFARMQENEAASQRSGTLENSNQPIDDVMRAWQDIVDNKDSYTKFWSGHPYKRWYSFCTCSPLEDLLKCSAKIYITQGTADTSTPVVSFDLLRAELLAHNRAFLSERIVGADHGLKIKSGGKLVSDKWPEVMTRILAWFFSND